MSEGLSHFSVLASLEKMDEVSKWLKNAFQSFVESQQRFLSIQQAPKNLQGLKAWINVVGPQLAEYEMLGTAKEHLAKAADDFRMLQRNDCAIAVLGWQLFVAAMEGETIDAILRDIKSPRLKQHFDSFFRVTDQFTKDEPPYCIAMGEFFSTWKFKEYGKYELRLCELLNSHDISFRAWESWLLGKEHGLSKEEFNFTRFYISKNLKEMNGQLSCKRNNPTPDLSGVESRVPPLNEIQTSQREQPKDFKVLVDDSFRIPKRIRDWLIARYLEDPQPDIWPIKRKGESVRATLVRFTDCTDYFLHHGIEMSVLDQLANAGFITDMRAIIEAKKDISKSSQPRAFLRLQLPPGDHRLLAIHETVLNSHEELNHNVKVLIDDATVTTKVIRKAGRPKDKDRHLVMKVIERERAKKTAWKDIPGIVKEELGIVREVGTLQQLYRTRQNTD